MQETHRPVKNPPKPPVYKAALDLDAQYCRSTKKAPQDVKYTHINRLHDTLIEIITVVAFANDTQDPKERADFISRAIDEVRKLKIRVRVLYDLHYITKKGFTAITRADLPPQKSLFFSPLGTGLTIGDVMSQQLSNIYLNPLDQYIKRELHVRHYGRYVDDGRAVDANYTFLEDIIQPISTFLRDHLSLQLHPNKVKITSTRQDNFFLGADCREYRRYVKNSTVASFHRAINQLEYWQATAAPSCLDDYYKALARINSYLGYFQHFKAYNIVARTLDKSPLRQLFAFTPYYRKAVLRPEIKEQLNYNNFV